MIFRQLPSLYARRSWGSRMHDPGSTLVLFKLPRALALKEFLSCGDPDVDGGLLSAWSRTAFSGR